jgi:hypothetical protein
MWDLLAVEQYDEGISEDSSRVDIDGLEEARCATLVQSARYLEGIRRYHDRNVKERSFNVGYLVLRRIQNTEGLHKLSSPWEGPFTVARVTGPGSYRLQTLGGDNISNSWNVNQLCGFYAWSLDYSGGSSLHDSRALRCKQPSGPGTSLRTTLLQDPALTATNGSRAAQGVKDSSSGLSRDHVLLDQAYTATNGSTAVSGHAP